MHYCTIPIKASETDSWLEFRICLLDNFFWGGIVVVDNFVANFANCCFVFIVHRRSLQLFWKLSSQRFVRNFCIFLFSATLLLVFVADMFLQIFQFIVLGWGTHFLLANMNALIF